MTQREQEFLEYVQSGGQVETDDWMPDEYRARLRKFIEMHGNSELMGVLPEREWILRAPTLQRKLALTAKVQDEVGHAQLIYRVVEDLGEARQQSLDGYAPQIWELGLTVPDPELRKDEETGRWHYTEPDWDELMSVVTGHGPKTEDRLDLRRKARESSAWIRSVVLAEAA